MTVGAIGGTLKVMYALSNERRVVALSHLYKWGRIGLRAEEFAREMKVAWDVLRHDLHILSDARLLSNNTGRDGAGKPVTHYVISDEGVDWLTRTGLVSNGRAVALEGTVHAGKHHGV